MFCMLRVWVGRGCNWARAERRGNEGGAEKKADGGPRIFHRREVLLVERGTSLFRSPLPPNTADLH